VANTIIPAVREVEIKRIMVPDQPRQNFISINKQGVVICTCGPSYARRL
jgi:hypothetical protein